MRGLARALGLPSNTAVEPAPAGASGDAWVVRAGADRHVIRRSSGPLTESRLAAMSAARRAGLPAPELVRRATLADHDALLLSWLPGVVLMEVLLRDTRELSHWGHRMGAMQRRLHAVTAPRDVISVADDEARPFRAGRGVPNLPDGDALLHLDWHPGNLLVDPDAGEICGIIDWDNSRRGHPDLDLARTHAVLTLDPGVASLPREVTALLGGFLDAWADGYGPEAHAIPEACRIWAARVMLADLEPRYVAAPEALDPIRRAAGG